MVVQMIGAQVTDRCADTVLTKIAEFYEDEVDVVVAGLVKLLSRS
jgi:hypothetical protein